MELLMYAQSEGIYQKPRLERFGTLRELTRVGCTLGGDGIWICRTPEPPDPSPPGNGDRS
jgi:hypothetical protein